MHVHVAIPGAHGDSDAGNRHSGNVTRSERHTQDLKGFLRPAVGVSLDAFESCLADHDLREGEL